LKISGELWNVCRVFLDKRSIGVEIDFESTWIGLNADFEISIGWERWSIWRDIEHKIDLGEPLNGLTGEAKLKSKMIYHFTRFSISHLHVKFLWKILKSWNVGDF
jgi:hypothetical protein